MDNHLRTTPTTTTRERVTITKNLIEKILRDSVDEGLSKLQIAKKRRCCFNTVVRILKDYEYGFWDKPKAPPRSPIRKDDKEEKEDKRIAKQRSNLSPSERMKELSNDSIEISEMIMKRMKDLLNDPDESISAAQLTKFLQTAAPYAIKKADGAAKSKDDDKPNSSSSKLFKIFKEQVS